MVRNLMSLPPKGRVLRSPRHSFQIESNAFVITPMMIAPVLPGETLKNLYFEARVVSDPVKNKLIGWRQEYHFFYVRMTDLLNDAIRDMFIDPTNTDLTATLGEGANDQWNYTAKGGIDYVERALAKVTEHWFRDEGEAWNAYQFSTGRPFAQFRERYWMDSLTDEDDYPAGGTIASQDMDQLEALMMAFEQLRTLGIANMTYEDFLRSYGISIPSKDENKPEKLVSFTDFQYPANTVTQGTGAVTSALSWVFKNSMRDPKMFKEPGFICGYSVTRPKIYYGGLAGTLAAHLSRAWDWLPNYMNEAAADPMPVSSIKAFAADTGPLGDRTTPTEAYRVDMRDLFLYGDQFQNVLPFADPPVDNGTYNIIANPSGDVDGVPYKYPTGAPMARSFFANTGASTSLIRQDGVCSLSIEGRQVDYTVGNLHNQI